MRLAILATALLFAMASSASANSKVDQWCANKWPSNYSQQQYCRDQQTEAVLEIADLRNIYYDGSEEWNIVIRCVAKWTRRGATDWRMSMYCANRELDAYEDLNY